MGERCVQRPLLCKDGDWCGRRALLWALGDREIKLLTVYRSAHGHNYLAPHPFPSPPPPTPAALFCKPPLGVRDPT